MEECVCDGPVVGRLCPLRSGELSVGLLSSRSPVVGNLLLFSEQIFFLLPQPLGIGTSQDPGFSSPQCSSKHSSPIVFWGKECWLMGLQTQGMNTQASVHTSARVTHTHVIPDIQKILPRPWLCWQLTPRLCPIRESLHCDGSPWEPACALSDKKNGGVCSGCGRQVEITQGVLSRIC